MCGFAGLVRPAGAPSWNPTETLHRMVGALDHRGPDDQGVWADEEAGVYLGFRRLSIQDLSEAGHQPMVSPSGRLVLIFNGEVYNFEDLRAELGTEAGPYRGHSDTEVILRAIERWGFEDAVGRFRGMFAIAVWDTAARRLWLARDRMGIKPLYLLCGKGGVAFSSEARSFHGCELFDGRGDPAVAASFLAHMYVPGRDSILSGVRRVAPGEAIEFSVDERGPREVRRFDFSDLGAVRAEGLRTLIRDPGEVADRLHELLRESVRLRMVADVPVGAFLSGGIDSSLVVAIMQELSTRPVKTFTIGFDDPDFDESSMAAEIASVLGTDHTSISFSAREVLDLMPTLPALSDEPMANPSLLPTLLVSRVARRDVTVALSGDGGDELFGGYNRYLHGAGVIRRMSAIPSFVRGPFGRLFVAGAGSSPAAAAFRALRPSSASRQQSPAERWTKVGRLLGARTAGEAYASLLRVGWDRAPFQASVPTGTPWEPVVGREDMEADMMFADQRGYLPDDLLAKVDRASMWESLEARVPILDQKVVGLSWRVPTSVKIRGGVTKWPLRAVLGRYVPPATWDRPKMGFTVPVARWLGSELREWARDQLGSGNPALLRIWDRGRLDRAWRAFEGGRTDLALALWSATVLQAWSEAWGVEFGGHE